VAARLLEYGHRYPGPIFDAMSISAFSPARSKRVGFVLSGQRPSAKSHRRRIHQLGSVFRLAELSNASYRCVVTTPTEVRIAGVPWPTYKLLALAVGMVVLIVVGLATTTVGPAVVAAAAAATVVWLSLSVFSHDR
jgi:hypothetical protein